MLFGRFLVSPLRLPVVETTLEVPANQSRERPVRAVAILPRLLLELIPHIEGEVVLLADRPEQLRHLGPRVPKREVAEDQEPES